jgi:hypothetical protein
MFVGTKNTPDYIRHTYKVSKELKSYTIYDFVEVDKTNQLTQTLRIEKFNGKSNATNINEYLRLRTTTSWSKSEKVTGLRPTQKEGLFYGDRITKKENKVSTKHLLVFQFSKDRTTLIIDYYRGFYPNHNGILQNIISNY